MIDPHPRLPAADGWQMPALAPQTATWVQLGYPPQGSREPPIVIAHWASDMSGEEQPGFEGWFRHNLGYGGKSYGFVEVPTGWVAWRPLWPADRAAEAAAHDARVTEMHGANNRLIEQRRQADQEMNAELASLHAQMTGLRAVIQTLQAAVQTAAATFDSYAASHAAKGTPDGDAKAATNAGLAERMREALGTPQPAAPSSRQSRQDDGIHT